MSKNSRIPLSTPVLGKKELANVIDCLKTGWVSTSGKYVNEFEEDFSKYVGSFGSVACVSGTSALHICLILAGVGQDDEVIVPTVTFIAPVNAVRYVGAWPVFMDCDDHLNLDVEKLEEFFHKECVSKKGSLINKKTKRKIKAVIPVHIFGNPADMEKITRLAKKYRLKVIEDATESLGSYFLKGKLKNKMTGTVGDFGCYSFNGNKIITTGGGGMIVTKDRNALKKAKYLTTQAKNDEIRYVHDEVGYNYRLPNVLAAIGIGQLEKLKDYIGIKRKNYLIYKKGLKNIKGLCLIDEPQYAFSNFWLYSLVVDKKQCGFSNLELMEHLSGKGIQTRPLWQLNHKQKPYRGCQAYKIEKAVKYHAMVLCLPSSVDLKEWQISKVVSEIKRYAKA